MSDGARLTWDDEARRAVEQETIYLRERLRARTETLVREAGRSRVTLADLSQARRMAAHRPAAEPAPVVEPE